jgi:2-oxoglutarate dehydrogenase E1 component
MSSLLRAAAVARSAGLRAAAATAGPRSGSALRPSLQAAAYAPRRWQSTSAPVTGSASSSFLNAGNSAYVDAMYHAWRADPSSVHTSWDAYFKTGNFSAPPTLVSDTTQHSSGAVKSSPSFERTTTAEGGVVVSRGAAKVLQMVRAFQVRGHLLAKLDPLGMLPPRPDHDDLRLETYGFSEADLDREIDISAVGEFLNMKGFLDQERGKVTLRKIYQRLCDTYCGTIGYEVRKQFE